MFLFAHRITRLNCYLFLLIIICESEVKCVKQDEIIHDLAMSVAKMFVEFHKDKYKTDKDYPTMVGDFFSAYSTAYTMLQKAKK